MNPEHEQVMRKCKFLQDEAEKILDRYIGEPNTPQVRERIQYQLNSMISEWNMFNDQDFTVQIKDSGSPDVLEVEVKAPDVVEYNLQVTSENENKSSSDIEEIDGFIPTLG